MVEGIELKVHDLEKDVKSLQKSQDRLWQVVKAMRDDLDKLVSILNQIRWMAAGAFLFFMAETVGITEAVKTAIKVL